ncbi:MAG: hypothetical protein ALAOOOJD_04078 [bacterium]|nr:hypothetical protein [bacterium]
MRQRLAAHRHERAGNGFDLSGFIFGEISQIVAPEPAAFREELAQAGKPREGDPRRGKAAATGELQRAIGIEDFATNHAGFRMFVKERRNRRKRIFLDDGVRIEQHDEAAGRLLQGLVVGAGKTGVFTIRDQLHFGKLALHHFDAAVV